MARAAAKAVSLEERVFMCVSQVVVIVDGVILNAILRVLTRYSANDRRFPVNDWSLSAEASPGRRDLQGCKVPRERPADRGRRAGAKGTGATRFEVVRRVVRKYHGRDVVFTSRFRIVEFLGTCPSWWLICAAVAGHFDLLGMYLLGGPNRASRRPTGRLRYRSSTPFARCADGCERGKERG